MQRLNYIFITFAFFVLFSAFSIRFVAAQQTFLTSIEVSPQHPVTKQFTLKANVNSQISSNRASINWEIPRGLDASGRTQNDSIEISEGDNQFELLVTAEKLNSEPIRFSTQVFEGTKRYTTNQSARLDFDNSLNLTTNMLPSEVMAAFTARAVSWNIFLVLLVVLVPLAIVERFVPAPKSTASKSASDSKILQQLNS